jgi:hypothetical protein
MSELTRSFLKYILIGSEWLPYRLNHRMVPPHPRLSCLFEALCLVPNLEEAMIEQDVFDRDHEKATIIWRNLWLVENIPVRMEKFKGRSSGFDAVELR